jgi:hypothetical protein
MGLEDITMTVHQAPLDEGGHRILVTWLSEERDAEISDRLQARVQWLAAYGAADAGGEN